VRDKTAEKYSIGSGRISHIENPIAPLNDQTKHWRRAHAKDGSILFIGRFDKRKGGDIALTAFEHILRSFPSANLTFVGPDYGLSNARGVPVKFSEFAASSLTSNTCSRVTFLGSQSQAEIEVLRLSAGVVFTASRWENQSYTGLEAMRQACPLVCVDSGGQAEIIEDGKTGLVALSHNPEDLARKIKYLLENPFEAERMGLRAKEYVEDVHAPDRVARLTLDIYNKVLA
jgi:glycosyltransferase involved in cell wall biosynthesis